MNQLHRIDTAVMYPRFLEKAEALLKQCRDRGAIYVATSGLRTWEQQTDLYARGRTAPGPKVTNAPAGFSPHNFGVAIDFARHDGTSYEGKLKPAYDEAGYQVLAEECARLDLEWGGAWKSIRDTPHVQLPLKSRGLSWERMRAAYEAGFNGVKGYEGVFSLLDTFAW